MKKLRRLLPAGLLLAFSLGTPLRAQVTLNKWQDVPFATGSASPEAVRSALESLAGWLVKHPECTVTLQGSAEENESGNQTRLAMDRAEAVKEFLIQQGVAEWRIRVVPLGQARIGAGKAAVSILVRAAQPLPTAPGAIARRPLPTAPPSAINRQPLPPPASIDSAQSDDVQIGKPAIQNRGRNFLTGKEPDGYGLYSYLLFTIRARNDDEKARYTALVRAFLNLNDIAKVEREIQQDKGTVDRRQLHLALLPVNEKPAKADADAVLDDYNYERAGILLRDLPRRSRALPDGAYFVWSLAPLSGGHTTEAMAQDLNSIPPGDLIAAWYQTLIDKAETPRDWQHRSFKEYALSVQTSLESFARRVPSAQQAMVASLSFFDGSAWKHPSSEK